MNVVINSNVNVALIGYGYAGKTFHAPLIVTTAAMKLSTVISSDEKKVAKDFPSTKEQVSVSNEADHAFSDDKIDLVVIATPNDTHFDLASRALNAGKHVVVDKPFTTTAEEARQLTAIARRNKRVLSVFHNRRWDGDFLTIKQLLNENKLGEVSHFESHFDRFRPIVQQRWRERPVAGGGLWFDLGPHLVDQTLQLFGDPDSVFGDLAVQRDGATAVDFFHVIMRYGNMRAIVHASALVAAESPRFKVNGKAGSFVKFGLDLQEDALKRGELPNSPHWGLDNQHCSITTWHDGALETKPHALHAGRYNAYYEGVRDAIQLGKPNPVTADQAIKVMDILELVEASSAARQELPYPRLQNKVVEQV